ncbi:ABC transporter substrate-binding protein [Paenibacillus sp. HB172176]|uniref:ABC transporter substrate-binding protein n=1 Tax=Paenibacillus sp. HB172176 TaxID=2493690 RepID=UPI00143B751C|nr:ABC transporter substrate-binding protein [Paenibacillus sp. HB172176]
MKKRWRIYGLLLMALMTAILVLGACSNDTEPAETSGGVAPTADTSILDPQTKTFEAANGSIEVPADPQRIVTLAPNYAGYLLALGVTPVGVPEFTLGNPYLKDGLEGVANLGANAALEPSIEQVLALKPDLIIALTVVKNVDELEKIAPVVTFDATEDNKKVLVDLGKLTNREAQASAWLEQWNNKINAIKPQVEAAVKDRTFSIMYPSAKGVYIFREGYGRGTEILYGDFGLKMPDKAAQTFEEGKGFSLVSLESMPELAGDYIITAPWLGDAAGADTVYDSSIWKGLPAVKEGRAFTVDYNIFTFSDPYSWEGQLDIILDHLLPDRDKSND